MVALRTFWNIRHTGYAVRRRRRNIRRRRKGNARFIGDKIPGAGIAVARLNIFETCIFRVARRPAQFFDAVQTFFAGIVAQYRQVIKNLCLVRRGTAILI